MLLHISPELRKTDVKFVKFIVTVAILSLVFGAKEQRHEQQNSFILLEQALERLETQWEVISKY